MNSSHFLSIDIVGVVFAITMILPFGVWRALLAAGKPPSKALGVALSFAAVLFAWLFVTLILGGLGIFRTAANQPFPYIALAIAIPIVVGALLLRWSRPVQEMVDALPQSWLVGIQFYRVVGVTFLVLHASGFLPGIFALPAGYGDAFVGLTALLVSIGYARYNSKYDRYVALWNWLGIADLVIAVTTGFLSSPSRFQIFSLNAPNILIGSFPLVMIPIYAVPLSILLHLASLRKLQQNKVDLRFEKSGVHLQSA
jgi:hypothetical protein